MTIPNEVYEIGQIQLNGNTTDHSWYEHIRFKNGKVDLASIMILGEIVYWYRPTYIRDEVSGKVIEVRKKFKADALQKSKQALADQFGLTERQVKDSLARLEEMKLIVRDYRTVITADGLKLSNVLFIKINPTEIAKITGCKRQPYDVSTSYLQRSNVDPPTPERQTYTESTTKTTTDISLSEQSDPAIAESLTDYLFEKMKEQLPSYKIKNRKLWLKDFDYITRLDKRTPEEVKSVIDWAHKDSLWKTVILSPSKLRDHFQTLLIKINASKESPKSVDGSGRLNYKEKLSTYFNSGDLCCGYYINFDDEGVNIQTQNSVILFQMNYSKPGFMNHFRESCKARNIIPKNGWK